MGPVSGAIALAPLRTLTAPSQPRSTFAPVGATGHARHRCSCRAQRHRARLTADLVVSPDGTTRTWPKGSNALAVFDRAGAAPSPPPPPPPPPLPPTPGRDAA